MSRPSTPPERVAYLLRELYRRPGAMTPDQHEAIKDAIGHLENPFGLLPRHRDTLEMMHRREDMTLAERAAITNVLTPLATIVAEDAVDKSRPERRANGHG